MRRHWPRLLAWLVLVLSICTMLYATREADNADQDQYCQMVGAGYWPDFHHTYKTECSKP